MKIKRCYLVRHGQTEWNSQNRLQGHSDLPLNPLGQQQAKCVAAFFDSRPIKGLYTSHLMRSRQTAQAIASKIANGIQTVVDAELAEMHLGEWEGLTPDEIDAKFAGAYRQWRTRPSSVVIPGAESPAAFRARVARAFERAAGAFDEGEYVIVSHGGVIAALLAALWDAEYDSVLRRLRLDNAGVTAIELGSGHPHALWVNTTAHLEASAVPATWF